jgi:hypothetical protein
VQARDLGKEKREARVDTDVVGFEWQWFVGFEWQWFVGFER